jgi:pyrrolysine biosynthesis protein PylD
MTRIRTEDIKDIARDLEAYDKQLLNKTGHTLIGIACHALGLLEDKFEDIVNSYRVCVIPLSCGQGVIKCFSATVNDIIRHLGFCSFVAEEPDVAGIAEAFENRSDMILLADDHRFVAINVHTGHVSDNTEMTAKGFVAGLDLMAGGVKGKETLVIGCGQMGCYTAKILVAMGVSVSACDIDPERALALQREILDELKAMIRIDNDWYSAPGKYQCMIDATPSAGFIDASMITPHTYVAVPGVPCGLSPEARNRLSDRYLHDPLQIGVATMVIDACNPSHTRDSHGF